MSECCSWQLGEGLVSRCEDSKRAFARESVDEPASLQRSDEGREIRSGDCKVHDGLGDGETKNCVNDVDDTVGGANIGCGDESVVDEDPIPHVDRRGDVLALDSLDLLAVCEVFREGSNTRHDVVSENCIQFLHIGRIQQMSECCSWQLGEGLVGWCEDSKWAFARESVDEPASLQRSDEGREIRSGDCKVHDGLSL